MPTPGLDDLKDILSEQPELTEEQKDTVGKKMEEMKLLITNPGDLTMTPTPTGKNPEEVFNNEEYRRKQKKLNKLQRKMDALKNG